MAFFEPRDGKPNVRSTVSNKCCVRAMMVLQEVLAVLESRTTWRLPRFSFKLKKVFSRFQAKILHHAFTFRVVVGEFKSLTDFCWDVYLSCVMI